MRAGHVGLSAEVFEVDPNRCRDLLHHPGLKRVWQRAAKRFNHHIPHDEGGVLGQLVERYFAGPINNRDAWATLWCHPCEGGGVVDPQANGVAALCKIGTQAPTHTQVAMVIDDATKNVPTRERWQAGR